MKLSDSVIAEIFQVAETYDRDFPADCIERIKRIIWDNNPEIANQVIKNTRKVEILEEIDELQDRINQLQKTYNSL